MSLLSNAMLRAPLRYQLSESATNESSTKITGTDERITIRKKIRHGDENDDEDEDTQRRDDEVEEVEIEIEEEIEQDDLVEETTTRT